MESLLTNLISGNIGTAIIALILWRSGLLKALMGAKNGNGDYKALGEKIDLLATNHIHSVNDNLCDVADTLKRIESHLEKHGDKLDSVKENVIVLKAKLLNGHAK